MNTRDLDTPADEADEDRGGTQLRQFESPAALHAPGGPGIRQRPVFSPVTQPGFNEEVWWHTVSDKPVRGPRGPYDRWPTYGMFARLHQEQREPDRSHHGRRRRAAA